MEDKYPCIALLCEVFGKMPAESQWLINQKPEDFRLLLPYPLFLLLQREVLEIRYEPYIGFRMYFDWPSKKINNVPFDFSPEMNIYLYHIESVVHDRYMVKYPLMPGFKGTNKVVFKMKESFSFQDMNLFKDEN